MLPALNLKGFESAVPQVEGAIITITMVEETQETMEEGVEETVEDTMHRT